MPPSDRYREFLETTVYPEKKEPKKKPELRLIRKGR